jgi:hypothetical protein
MQKFHVVVERMLAESEGQGIRKHMRILRNASITGTVIIWTCMSGSFSCAFQY